MTRRAVYTTRIGRFFGLVVFVVTFFMVTACSYHKAPAVSASNDYWFGYKFDALHEALVDCIERTCDRVSFSESVWNESLMKCATEGIRGGEVFDTIYTYSFYIGSEAPVVSYISSRADCSDVLITVHFGVAREGFERAVVAISLF